MNWRFECPIFIDTCLWRLFYICSQEIQKKLEFRQNYAKMTIFHKNENFRRINGKINRLLKKIYSNIPAEFESGWCRLYWVIAKTNNDNSHTQTYTHTHTNIHFRQTTFFSIYIIYMPKKSRNLTIDFWLRLEALLNQKLRKQNWHLDLIYRPNFFWKL